MTLKAERSQDMAGWGQDLAPPWTNVNNGDRLIFPFSWTLCFLMSNLEVITQDCFASLTQCEK